MSEIEIKKPKRPDTAETETATLPETKAETLPEKPKAKRKTPPVKRGIHEKMKMELESDPLDKLSPLHRAFCYAYVENGGNGTRAYMLVYPKCSYNAASVRAYDLLRTDKIIAGIKQIYSKIWKDRETDIEKGKTYNQIHALALADISEVIDLKGGTLSVKTLDDIPEHARKAIQSIEYIRKKHKGWC